MAKKDITQKTIEGFNDVFADIANVLLFDGEEVVHEDELTDAATFSQYKVTGRTRAQERDVAKYWEKGKLKISFLGLENQTDIDRDMPLRVISYDGAAYRDQIASKKSAREERYPVVTLVLYYGYEKRWDKYRSLIDSIRVDDGLKPYVNDYEINLFEIAYLDRETIDKFRSDFRILADYCWQMRTTGDYIPSPDELIHPRELLEALAAFTEDNRFEQLYIEKTEIRKGGKANMCEYLDRLEARGEAKGKTNLLIEMVKENLISYETALSKAPDKTKFIEAFESKA